MEKYKLNLSKYSTHRIILDSIGSGKVVLDVGCNGGYLGAMSRSNYFYGIDIDESGVKNARKSYVDAVVCDLNKNIVLPWDKKFDVIIFADVLEHLVDPKKVLQDILKYLSNDGLVIISLPNIANWQMRLKLLFGNFDSTETGIMDETHLHFYTFKTGIELIKKVNLKIKNIYGGSSFFGVIIDFFPLFKSFFSTNIIIICQNEK